MVQQQSPVVLSDEDENKFRSANESYTSDTRTLAEREAAGEVVVDDTPVTYTEEGIPRLTVSATPVKLKPKPEANVPEIVSVTSPIESVIPPKLKVPKVTFKSLQTEAEESVAEKKAQVTTYDDVVRELEAGNDVTIDTGDGVQTFTGTPSNAALAKNESVATQIKLGLRLQNQNTKTQEEETFPDEPKISFVTQTGRIDTSSLDPEFRPHAQAFAESRKALDDVLRPIINTGRPDIDVAVRQYFIDDFTTGDILSNLNRRLAETGRAVPILPTFGAQFLGSAVEAITRANRLGTTFSEEWESLAGKRDEALKDILEQIDEFIPAPTMAMGLNDAIRERAKEDFEEGKFSDDPELNKAIYEDFVFETSRINGEKVERQFIDEETAYQIIEESFSQMNGVEQFVTIAGENVLGGGILGKTKNMSAAKELAIAERSRKLLGASDDISVFDLQKLALEQSKKIKLNDDLLELALYNKALSRELQDAKVRIKALKNQAATIGISSVEKERLLAEALNLSRMRTRNFARRTLSPYIKEVIGGETSVALAATIGRNTLEGTFGMSGDQAELAGFAGGLLTEVSGANKLLFKGGVKLTKTAVGVPLKGALNLSPEGIRTPFNAMISKLTQADLTVQQYEDLFLGSKLSLDERRGVIAAFKQVEKMDDETKEFFLETLQAQLDIEDDLLKMFPEGEERMRAGKFLRQSLAELTGLPRAISAYQLASEATSIRKAKKGGLGAMLESAVEVDRRVARAQILIDGFKKHASEFANPDQKAAVLELIETANATVQRVKTDMDSEFVKMNKHIDKMIYDITSDISEPLPETFYEDFAEAKAVLNKRINTGDSKEIIEAFSDLDDNRKYSLDILKALEDRFEQIRLVRDRRQLHRSSLETAVEAMIFERQGNLATKMDAVYDDFRKFVAETDRPNIDISEAVSEMLRLASSDDKDITTFFGPTSTFFSGYLGRKSMKMFDRMVTRGLDKFNEDEISEMAREIVENSGGRLTVDDVDNLMKTNRTGFGLLLHQTGAANIFANANIEEVEEFRRAFRDYGYKTSNPAVAREYKQFEELIDGIMQEGDPEAHKVLVKTRKVYTQLNDPNRPNSPLNRILRSKVKDKESMDSSPYAGMYKNITPIKLFDEIGKSVRTMMSGGDEKPRAVSNLKEQLGYLTQLFGTPQKGGEIRIDLRTEEGEIAIDLIEEVLEAIIYDGWAADFLSKRPAVGARVDPRNLGFKQTVIDELEALNDEFLINVVDLKGKDERVLAVNITKLISEEKDIAKLVVQGGKFHKQGQKAASNLSIALKAGKETAQIVANEEQATMKILEDITQLKNSGDFYTKYIREYGNLDALRMQFVETVKKDPSMAGVDTDFLFDNAIYNLTYQGLMQVGGYGPVAKKAAGRIADAQSAGLLGEGIVMNGFSDVVGALAELENPEVLKNLEKVMDTEQIGHIRNIFTYLANQNIVQTANELVATKGISMNEALSRAYNIARGLVSPTYVASDVGLRVLRKINSDALMLAFQSKEAGRIMAKLLMYPKSMTPRELKTFDTILTEFLVTEVSRKQLEITLTDYLDSYTGENNDE